MERCIPLGLGIIPSKKLLEEKTDIRLRAHTINNIYSEEEYLEVIGEHTRWYYRTHLLSQIKNSFIR